MDIDKIQQELDELYEVSLDNAYAYMVDIAGKAMQQGENEVLLFILNELMGYYRVTSKFEEGDSIARKLIDIIYSLGLENSLAGATSFLNVATMYRTAKQFDIALKLYEKTEEIYLRQLDESDERLPAFFNNFSLFYLEMKEYNKAIALGQKALSLIEKLHKPGDEAVSLTNLAQMYIAVNQIEKAKEYLLKAIDLFEHHTVNDSHYYAALSTLASIKAIEGNIEEAKKIYNQALEGIERVYGKSQEYYTVLSNKESLQERKLQGLDVCKKFYQAYKEEFLEGFEEYKQYMCFGMFGFGSDCLGYDDAISTDHDFGPGFICLLPQDIYTQIGKALQARYNALPDTFMGYKRMTTAQGTGRVGVYEINSFFNNFLKKQPETLEDWLYQDENTLLVSTNGQIFDDYLGTVSHLRKQLSYYPEDIRIKKIARSVAKMAQSGQYNYARCMLRGNSVAASLALNEFIDQTLSVVYLLNRKYKPYYKWSFYGFKDLTVLYDIKDMIEALVELPMQKDAWKDYQEGLNTNDPKVVLIEKICKRVVEELNKQGLSTSQDDFLENHTQQIMQCIQDTTIKNKHVMEG